MKIIEIEQFDQIEEVKDLALCLGFYDGFHLGHMSLFNKALENNAHVGIMTFDISPKNYLNHNEGWPSLLSLSDKVDFLEKIGFDYFYILRLNDELLNMTCNEFIKEILKRINPKKIYCGQDYTFGRFGAGTPDDLKEIFDVEVVNILKLEDKKISTHDVIVNIEKGKIEKANELLGRNYSLIGLVVEGNKVGSSIGFPTANLKLDFNYVLPAIGVYAGYAVYMGRRYKAIISVSTHPSIFELKAPIIEVHFINFEGNLYGKEIKVEFARYLRDIIKFNSLDELKEQLSKDKENARVLLN